MNKVRDFIFQHIGKLVPYLFFCVFFLFWLFPYESLTGLLTQKIYEASRSSIFVDFETSTDPNEKPIEFVLVPDPGLQLKNINVIGEALKKEVHIGSIVLFPNLSSPLSGITILAEQLFGGEVKIKYAVKKNSDSKTPSTNHQLDIRGTAIGLPEIGSYLNQLMGKNLELNGDLNMNAQIETDTEAPEGGSMTLKGQPHGSFELIIKKATAATAQLVGPDYAMLISKDPILHIETVIMKAKMKDGKISISDGKIESPGNFTAKLEGDIDFSLRQLGSQFIPMMGQYTMTIGLQFLGGADKNKGEQKTMRFRIRNPDSPGASPKFEIIN